MFDVNFSKRIKEQIEAKCFAYINRINITQNVRRENRKAEAVIRNHFNGKFGEFVVSYYLYKNFNKIAMPDISFHKIKKHDQDIMLNGSVGIHVKTCTSDTAKRYGMSWCFGTSDPLVREPLEHLDEYIILVYLDLDDDIYKVSKLFRWKNIYKYLKDGRITNPTRKFLYEEIL